MTAKIPFLPLAVSTVLRAALALLALVTRWFKEFAKARRHRHQAATLAGLDRRLLADMGLTRSDLSDAFSEPFWEDPTALLRERAIERRLNRPRIPATQADFRRPPTNRPARQTV